MGPRGLHGRRFARLTACGLALCLARALAAAPAAAPTAATPAPPPRVPQPEPAVPDCPPPGVRAARGACLDPARDRVFVPAGWFLRGAHAGEGESDEHPQQNVWLDAFWIDRTEVTVAAYRRCIRAGRCSRHGLTGFRYPQHSEFVRSDDCNAPHAERGDYPMNCVDWHQARAYCRFAKGRLPTEAEWEKAARGPGTQHYPWGDLAPSCALAVVEGPGPDCVRSLTAPVGTRPLGVSPYGALDMAGNVWEWVFDRYADSYADLPVRNPRGPARGRDRVFRGGGAHDDLVSLRVTARSCDRPNQRGPALGFRCAAAHRAAAQDAPGSLPTTVPGPPADADTRPRR